MHLSFIKHINETNLLKEMLYQYEYRRKSVFSFSCKILKNADRPVSLQSLVLHSARRLMLVDTCIKFREYSLSGFQVIERTRFCDGQISKENNSKSIKGRVTILALCTSSHAD